jgi:hypothetical protein
MNDPSTAGVLLKSEDGSHYFIPYSDLSQYAAHHPNEAEVASEAPRVEALSVSRTGTEAYSAAAVAFPPFPEG